jgi:hypothetical protein
MNDIRVILQKKLEEIQNLEVTSVTPDSILEKNKTYFSYQLQKTYINSDHDRNYTYRINITGFIKRLENDQENTLEIVDNISDEIENKLKELNMKTNFIDVTVDNIRKIQVTGELIYNEINKGLL